VSIVCRNNFGIKDDENILFEYGIKREKETKPQESVKIK
jgi:hypothetical protein